MALQPANPITKFQFRGTKRALTFSTLSILSASPQLAPILLCKRSIQEQNMPVDTNIILQQAIAAHQLSDLSLAKNLYLSIL